MTQKTLCLGVAFLFLLSGVWMGDLSFAVEESHSISREGEPKVELLGTLLGKRHGPIAIFQESRFDRVTLVAINDQIEGWRIARIDLGTVTLVQDGRQFKIALTKRAPQGLLLRVDDQMSVVNTSVLNEILETHSLNKEWGRLKVSPRIEQGRIAGWRIDTLKKGSLLKDVGIREGDIILKVNGKGIGSLQEGFSLAHLLRKSWKENPRLEIQVERKGKPQTLVYLLN